MGIKRNFFFSSILNTANYIFPLIIFPYISRVLGVNNIGICNFVDSIINYFILFSMMGLSITGIREIAKVKKDKSILQQTFSSLFVLNLISTSIALILLIIGIYTIPQLKEHQNLMWIGAVKLVFSLFLIEWFFKGIENFKYITIRTVAVRCFFLLCVFLLVKEKDDFDVYYGLLVGTTVINAFFNWKYLLRILKFDFSNISISPYIKSFFVLGVYSLLTSMYTSLNVVYLGFVAGEKEVGYYTTAIKIYTILLSLFTALSGVLLPRFSVMVAENKMLELKNLIFKSLDLLCMIRFPLIVFTEFFTPQIIEYIAGNGYQGAITPMRIVMPLMFIIGLEQIYIIQLLMPMKEDKIILRNSLIGALAGIVFNILLVSTLKSVGSSIVWLISELCVLFSAFLFVHRKLNIDFDWHIVYKRLLSTLPYILICFLGYFFIEGNVVTLFFIGFSCVLCFFIQELFFVKTPFVINIVKSIYRRIM